MIFKATETLGGAPVILWVKHHGIMKSLAHQVEVQRLIYRVFQKFVPIFSSLKFHWLIKITFVNLSMLLIIHLTLTDLKY